MNDTSKMILTVIVVTVLTAVFGYFLGFAGLFTHSMSEIFYYAGLFGGVQVLALMVKAWWTSGRPMPVVSINTPSSESANSPNFQA